MKIKKNFAIRDGNFSFEVVEETKLGGKVKSTHNSPSGLFSNEIDEISNSLEGLAAKIVDVMINGGMVEYVGREEVCEEPTNNTTSSMIRIGNKLTSVDGKVLNVSPGDVFEATLSPSLFRVFKDGVAYIANPHEFRYVTLTEGKNTEFPKTVKTVDVGNLRYNPEFGDNIIGFVHRHVEVIVLGETKGWAMIQYEDQVGYVGKHVVGLN